MEVPIALRFAEAVRRLTDAARQRGLATPAFRSPPRTPGVPRALRRYRDGAVVAVALRGRSFEVIAADMVDGVLAVNHRRGAEAGRLRAELLSAIGYGSSSTVAPAAVPTVSAPVLVARRLPSGSPARVAERHTQAA